MKKFYLIISGLLVLFLTSIASAQETTTTDTAVTLTPTTINTTPASTTTSPRSAALTQAAARRSAVTTQAAERKTANVTGVAVRKEETEAKRLERIKQNAVRAIDQRITSLSSLITRIEKLEKLSATQKTALITQVQNEITTLTALKTKIQADTDLATLKIDTASIVSSFRIYALFVPKIHIMTVGEGLLSLQLKMNDTVYLTLKDRVASAAANGVDTTSMNASLTSMETHLAEAKSQATLAISSVTPLTPDGYPANKPTLDAARENLKTARKSLRSARQDGRSIIRDLRKIKATVSPQTTTGENASPAAVQ